VVGIDRAPPDLEQESGRLQVVWRRRMLSSQGEARDFMERIGVGPRAIAVIIDSLIFVVFACCFFLALALVSGGEFEQTGGPAILLQLALGVIYYAYFIILEGTSGSTFGKRIMKLRVVKVDGSQISMGDAAIRNVLRVIDGILFYLIGAIIIWTSMDKQRLGDRVAKTIVVSTAPAGPQANQPTEEQRF
jgi:uncharacterized RDD family membrane protein YckC